ncbi:LA_3751/LA_3752 family putative glycosyltransferase [Leptospira adleri]|uniref:Glycosyltransferase RgtA/B/C/D-like domain-containing protein n=1 Tax=Leptospira adleri TaxID=2023186 RepID=A0A2M9YQ77_9LEPT|nr:hypothetical protein [Leptospira adleri]PJZ53694.1 hypothetical protein CH380_08895 [Leptospira adleri]PJZ61227.1 hypothetical protein CH376_14505 [Leptospira adleri]
MTPKLKEFSARFLQNKYGSILAAFLFSYFLYLTVPPKYLLSADHYEKFILGKSIFLSGFRSLDVFYPGFDFDPELKFSLLKMSIVNGHKIIAFPISLGILYAIAYPFGGAYAIYFLSALLIGLSLFLIGREFKIPSWQIFLFSILTPSVMNGYLFMDVGVGLFLFVSGMLLYQKSKKNPSPFLMIVSAFFLSLCYWFRLEYLIFLGIYWVTEMFLQFRLCRKIKDRTGVVAISILLFIFFLGYCGFNFSYFHSILGPRFNANYDSSGGANLFKNFINLLFYGNLKLGLFGYSPFLLFGIVLFSFSFFKNWKESKDNEKTLITSSILGITVAAITAPNDGGAEFGSRYLTPGLPGLFLLASKALEFLQRKSYLWRIPFYVLFAISILPTWIYYKTTKGFAKNTKAVQEFILKEPKENLLVFQNGLLGGMASEGLYFQGRVYEAINVQELVELLEKYSSLQKEKSIPFEYFAYAKEYTEGMKDLKYEKDTKNGMLSYLNQFDPDEISKIQSIRIVKKQTLGSIEIIYGTYIKKE